MTEESKNIRYFIFDFSCRIYKYMPESKDIYFCLVHDRNRIWQKSKDFLSINELLASSLIKEIKEEELVLIL